MTLAKNMVAAALSAVLVSTTLLAAPTVSAQTVEPLDTTELDSKLDQYWKAQERKAYRKALFDKADRHEFSIFLGVVPNDSFFSYVPVGARWNFYFTDAFAVEVFGAYDISIDGDLKSFLEEKGLYPILNEFPQQLQWNANAAIVWTPLHGKVAAFTTKLFHFDFNISLGLGVIGTTLQRPGGTEDSLVDFAGHLGLGLRFYVDRMIAIRADYKQFLYGAEAGIAVPAEFTFGVSFWTD